MLNFCFFTIIIFLRLGKFSYNGAAEGPTTIVNLELGYFSRKYLIIPVDKILSPIKFEEITNIFTDRFYC